MEDQRLYNLIRGLKLEIIRILANTDWMDEKEARRTFLTIENTFQRLNIDVEDILPTLVYQRYLEGLAEISQELYVYNIDSERLSFNFEEPTQEQAMIIQSTLQNQLHYEAVSEVSENLMMDLKASIRTARESTNLSIVNALTDVQTELQSGMIRGKNRRYISNKIAESFESNGFMSFTTKDRRQIPLDVYAPMVTRTNLKIAHTRGATNRLEQNNINLFTIGGNYPTCHVCNPYRGIVFSSDPENKDFPYLDPNSVPFHPNCQCSIRPYVISYKTKKEINKAKREAKNFNPNKETRSNAEIRAYARKQQRNRINNYEKKRYAEIQAIMGEDAPKTLGAFKRMKRANTDNYQALIYDFNEKKRLMRERGISI